MRDLNVDLAICETATPGPWHAHNAGLGKGHTYASFDGVLGLIAEDSRIEDARFIAEAREGWPEAIRRAQAAEEALERIQNATMSQFLSKDDMLRYIKRVASEVPANE